MVKAGEKPSPIKAEIAYNGTGRLRGRWEVVLPGEQLPEEQDLLTEASLPIEQRSMQRRYTQLGRFNVFLPPSGKYTLAGPDVSRLPVTIEGPYLLLLRIETTDDKEGDSNLAALGVGPGIVHGGAVAGFPMPVLRYFVGSGQPARANSLRLLLPSVNSTIAAGQVIDFSWTEVAGVTLYQLEIADEAGQVILAAALQAGTPSYRAPPWLREKTAGAELQWRVAALDQNGIKLEESLWQKLQLAK
jgi:hypothetical protein